MSSRFVGILLAALMADASGPARGIDLLALIDARKDAVAGTWEIKGGVVHTPSLMFGRIQIPYIPPEEYDLHVVLERRGSGNSLNLGLASGDRQFSVILDGIDNDPQSGLELIDGKGFFANATTVKGRLIPNDASTRVICRVRRGSLVVRVGDRNVIDWKGDFKALSLHAGWKMPDARTLFLGSWQGCDNRVTSLRLYPVGKPGRPLR